MTSSAPRSVSTTLGLGGRTASSIAAGIAALTGALAVVVDVGVGVDVDVGAGSDDEEHAAASNSSPTMPWRVPGSILSR